MERRLRVDGCRGGSVDEWFSEVLQSGRKQGWAVHVGGVLSGELCERLVSVSIVEDALD